MVSHKRRMLLHYCTGDRAAIEEVNGLKFHWVFNKIKKKEAASVVTHH